MSFDLRRTYLGVTSFIVLMVVFFTGIATLNTLSTIVVLAPVPFADRVPPGYTAQAYGVAIAPAPAVTDTATPAPAQLMPPPPDKIGAIQDWEVNNAREQTATSVAALLVAAPIWLFHWRRFRKAAAEQNAYLMYRVYAYATMTVALIAMIIAGGDLLGQPLLALLGAADLSGRYAQLQFIYRALGSGLSLVWAIGFWLYHWRVSESVPVGR
jgi:hypothetical protein